MITVAKCIYCKLQFLQSALREMFTVKIFFFKVNINVYNENKPLKSKVNVPLF